MQPLADKLRPKELKDVVGQQHLTGTNRPLAKIIENDHLHSMILWGPPGTGKTTLAQILCNQCQVKKINLSAILSGVADIRKAIKQAEENRQEGQSTVLFVDEIHRFNKSQQDAFLPHMENGLITLIGATTENPSFALNNALLSRSRVYILKNIGAEDLRILLEKAIDTTGLELSEIQQNQLIQSSDGDARRLLTLLEILSDYSHEGKVKDEEISLIISGQARRFDNKGDVFYEQISALHKCVRSSNPDAALYWMNRMLDGGCDPQYIARRLLRMASEEVGNADPRALTLCLDAWETWRRLGSPEGDLALAQAAVYVASCPKSNAVYSAHNESLADAKKLGSLDVPMHLRNAPTSLMKNQGFGSGYQYDHDNTDSIAYSQKGFPEKMGERVYYQPKQAGLEIKIAQKLEQIRKKRND
ncbi:MAG: replication-associated recombination protein A [Marinicellaceae bacterium]